MLVRLRFSFFLSVFVLFCRCANVEPLVGGIKDLIPPKVDSAQSSPNNALNFSGRSFFLVFDEWVAIKNAQKQVLVSPPLTYPPNITLKGKKVVFEFDEREVLRPNTTYVVNFGAAVQDLTEANVPPELMYIFSTGTFIDSLRHNILVTDAFSNAALEGITVMLFDNLTDTAYRKTRPLYFAKTNAVGKAVLQNLKPGTYQLVAIEDQNSDFMYGGERELIALAPTFVVLSADSVTQKIELQLSQSQSTLQVLETSTDKYGLAKVTLSRSATHATFRVRDAAAQIFVIPSPLDSLTLFYSTSVDTTFQVIVAENGLDSDTFAIRAKGRSDFMAKVKLKVEKINNGAQASKGSKFGNSVAPVAGILPGRDLELLFNQPIANFDASKMNVLLDSTGATLAGLQIRKDSLNPLILRFNANWPENGNLKLQLLPGAATDIYSSVTDSLLLSFKTVGRKSLGDVVVKLGGLDATKQYFAALLEGESVVAQVKIPFGTSNWEHTFFAFSPNTYTLRVHEDRNKNDRWDAIDLATNTPPERQFYKKLEPLRPNWTLEVQTELAKMKDNLPKTAKKSKK